MKIFSLRVFYRFFFGTAIFFLFSFALNPFEVEAQSGKLKSVLYINSYGITYSWGDSVAKGVIGVFSGHPDINLYVEYLDCKRFGNSGFKEKYVFLKNKYRNIQFDVAIVSDNDALDFITIYGDSLIPKIPVVFCGINNPEDYSLEQSRFYGIKEGVDQDSVNRLILKIIPGAKKLYFLFDKTTTSLVNLKYVKKLESKYAKSAEFVYILDISVDSILKVVPTFEKGNAIAIIDIFQDKDRKPVNSDILAQKIAEISPVPIFIDSETSFGKGILGGIFNKGALHGRDAAMLALRFLNEKDFKPKERVSLPKDKYFFDYRVLAKYNIDLNLLPESSVIINTPSTIKKYLKYIFGLLFFAGFLIIIIIYLIININRRKKAENIVKEKLEQIKKQNYQLEEANIIVNNLNTELEELNEHLSLTNNALLEAKLKAEEADKLKSAFLANMSHEIRTPLNAIVCFSSLSTDPSLSSEIRQYFANIINVNCDQLLKLIDDILDLSKIEAGQTQVTNEIFSVKEIYDELYHSSLQDATNKKIELRVSYSVNQNSLMLKSDRTRFKQILSNFLSNAIKFTSEGFVELGYFLNDSMVPVFYVKDTGIGMDTQIGQHIFDRFWKYEGNNDKFYSGTGLGLAICKKLSELLGGEIWFESTLNKGSVFYFKLPKYTIVKEVTVEPKEIAKSITRPDWTAYSLVIAEDEEYNLQYLIEILKPTKINVLTFRNGVDVVSYFSNNRGSKVDILLMDIKMPQMDGVTAARLIKKIFPKLPIIAQTAYAMNSDIKRIKTADFDDYITKPIKANDLIEKIQSFLRK